MNSTSLSIDPGERGLAALTHLSGLAGYIIPFGGVLVPIIIWIVKKDSAIVSSIAKQAVLLNVIAFLMCGVVVILALTIILIPLAFLLGTALFLGALALPIIGAVKATDGTYYRYPVVGIVPQPTLSQV